MFMNQKVVARNALLSDTPTVLASGTTNARTRISSATFCNTDTVARTISVWLVPAGDSAGPANQIHQAYGLAAGETYTSPHLNHIINDGDQIIAQADAAGVVSVYVSGIEMSKAG